jgi:hypothetical protein
VLAVAACIRVDAEVLHPAELSGRWIRLRPDGSWGDTLEFLADGRVHGSVGNPVPESARWSVVRSRVTGEAFCAVDARDRGCRQFRVEGDTMVLGGLTDATYFRRVR